MTMEPSFVRSPCLVCHEDFVCRFKSKSDVEDRVKCGEKSISPGNIWDTFIQCFNVQSPSNLDNVLTFFSDGQQLPFCERCKIELNMLAQYRKKQDSISAKIQNSTSFLQNLMNQGITTTTANCTNNVTLDTAVVSNNNINQQIIGFRNTIQQHGQGKNASPIPIVNSSGSSNNDNRKTNNYPVEASPSTTTAVLPLKIEDQTETRIPAKRLPEKSADEKPSVSDYVNAAKKPKLVSPFLPGLDDFNSNTPGFRSRSKPWTQLLQQHKVVGSNVLMTPQQQQRRERRELMNRLVLENAQRIRTQMRWK